VLLSSGRRAALAALLILAPLSATAQSRTDEQAKRLLEDGRQYRTQGKLKQALDNFTTIVTSFSDSDSVDDALLEIGRYRMEVEGDYDKARASFEQVTKLYPQSDGAPGAYYWLGRLTLNRATTPAELDDALAQFTRVQRLYPRSDWVPQAMYASGLVDRRAGRMQDAIEIQRRVALEYPRSDAAAAAQFEVGQCYALTGEPRVAMEEFQQVRNRFAESSWAPLALDRITALYRLYGTAHPTFNADTSYSVGSGDMLKDVTALLMTPDRSIWIASGKAKSIFNLSPEGKPVKSVAAEDPRSLSWSPKGDIVAAARTAVRFGGKDIKSFAIPSEKPAEPPEALEKIEAAFVLPSGTILVADGKKRRVYRYDDQFRYQGTFPDAKEHRVTRILQDGEGAILMLDEDEKTVRSYDVSGRVLRTVAAKGTGYELKHPFDIAVDSFRNLYVADEAVVHVFNAQGQILTTIGGDTRRPGAITLDPAGALLMYDQKTQKVVRFQ
jgi:outer membrane protein assembly factor BamD (BamD/ComL family)